VKLSFRLGQAGYHDVTCEVDGLPPETRNFPGGETALLLRLALMQEAESDLHVYVGEKNVYDLRETHRTALRKRCDQIPDKIENCLISVASSQRQDIVESSQDTSEVWAKLLYFLREKSASPGRGYHYRLNARQVSLSVVIDAS
jgi:hypothetical protein